MSFPVAHNIGIPNNPTGHTQVGLRNGSLKGLVKTLHDVLDVERWAQVTPIAGDMTAKEK